MFIRRFQAGSAALVSNLKSERIETLRAAGERWLVFFLFLVGVQGIVITAALGLIEPLATIVTPTRLIPYVAVTSLVLSLLLLTSLGTKVRERIGVPYIGSETRPGKFLAVALQLGLLLLLTRTFEIESVAFIRTVFAFAVFGFLVQHALPPAYRLPFFAILSLVAIFTVLGLENGAWVISLCLLMIGICHLPVKIGWRIGLLLAAAAFFVLGRIALVPVPWSSAVWPILASLLMFRLIVYLYELHHNPVRPTLSQTLAYFFMLPNVVFPLFPVVDFNTMRRTYMNQDEYVIYQRGVRWILRGIVFLLLYRVSYYFLVMAPSEVQHAGDLVRFVVANYLLLLRLIGQFDLIIGILCLFGFHLPEANLFNFFAVSFTDFWRRNNPYWREFMMKLVYYPSFFRTRGRGLIPGMLLATVVVFAVTWFMHGYQWFWILGTFPVTLPDILFWMIFAVLLSANLIWELKRGRTRAVPGTQRRTSDLFKHVVFGLAMFVIIAVMWSLWTSASLEEWFSLWNAAAVMPELDLQALALAVGVAIVFFIVYLGAGLFGQTSPQGPSGGSFYRGALFSGVLILGLYFAGNPLVVSRVDPNIQTLLRNLKVNRLNAADSDMMVRGYYENIMFTRANSELWQVYMNRSPEQNDAQTHVALLRQRADFLGAEPNPSLDIVFKGARLQTNQWGMRDQEYAVDRPPRTYRIALFGASYVMGSGVSNAETFENLVEERINLEYQDPRFDRYEILNFAAPNYGVTQHLAVLEEKALRFKPDAVILVGNGVDGDVVARHLSQIVLAGTSIPYTYLEQIARRAGITQEVSPEEAERRLRPFRRELLEWTLGQIVAVCRAHQIRPIWVLMPIPKQNPQRTDALELIQLAEQAGFAVINSSDVYEGHDATDLVLSIVDGHPNVKGHQLIANRLYQELRRPEIERALFAD